MNNDDLIARPTLMEADELELGPARRLRRAVLRRFLGPALRVWHPLVRRSMQIGGGNRVKDWIWEHVLKSYLYDGTTPVIVRTRFGPYMLGKTTNLVFRTIAAQGVWEPNLSAFIRSRLRTGDTFVDVGANIGYYTLLAAKSVDSSGSVIAIEPLPSALTELRRNLEINDFQNVRVLAMAAHDCEGETTIRFNSMTDVGGASITLTHERPFEALVRTAPLSTTLSTEEIGRARLFKFDVEGAETSAVRGLLARADEFRDDVELIVELSPFTYPEIAVMLGELGFEPYVLDNPFSASNPRARPAERPRRLARGAPLPDSPDHFSYVVFSRRDAATL